MSLAAKLFLLKFPLQLSCHQSIFSSSYPRLIEEILFHFVRILQGDNVAIAQFSNCWPIQDTKSLKIFKQKFIKVMESLRDENKIPRNLVPRKSLLESAVNGPIETYLDAFSWHLLEIQDPGMMEENELNQIQWTKKSFEFYNYLEGSESNQAQLKLFEENISKEVHGYIQVSNSDGFDDNFTCSHQQNSEFSKKWIEMAK